MDENPIGKNIFTVSLPTSKSVLIRLLLIRFLYANEVIAIEENSFPKMLKLFILTCKSFQSIQIATKKSRFT